MIDTKTLKQLLMIAFIVLLGWFMMYGLRPYINAFFIAMILFVLFRPLNERLKKRWKPSWAAIAIMLLSVIVVLIPATILFAMVAKQASSLVSNPDMIDSAVSAVQGLFPNLDIAGKLSEMIGQIGKAFANAAMSTASFLSQKVLVLLVTYFCFYYLLVTDTKKLLKGIEGISPYNKQNTKRFIEEFKSVTQSTIVTTGVLAIMQGALLAILFYIVGIPAALFWGFVGAFMSFLPVVGVSFLWIPAAIFQAIAQDWTGLIIMLIGGTIISNVDNFIRPMLQKHMGDMHPLVSLLGILIGLPLFGLIGIVMGPLLISYFLLAVRLFKEEQK